MPFETYPYKEKLIKDVSEYDINVAVSGVIINKAKTSFILDDGSSQVSIFSENIPDFSYVRVFGQVLPFENGFEIQAQIIQDLSLIDKELYTKYKKFLNQK
jgi:hypothetical protein